MLGERKAAEEQQCVEEVASDRVLEEGNRRRVASDKAVAGERIDPTEHPHTEVRDREEGDRTCNGCRADAQRRSSLRRPPSDDDDQRYGRIYGCHAVIEAEYGVAQ